jgi:hypothetical protein
MAIGLEAANLERYALGTFLNRRKPEFESVAYALKSWATDS